MATNNFNKYASRSKKYTFMNQGTAYEFDPNKRANVNGKLSNLLELHKSEVKFRNSKLTYILNENGEVLTE